MAKRRELFVDLSDSIKDIVAINIDFFQIGEPLTLYFQLHINAEHDAGLNTLRTPKK